jgi:carboxyl-terminal processing protease
MSKVRGYGTLILDLRSNRGGYVKTLERLLGYFFDRDLKVSDVKSRKKEEPIVAKTRGNDAYKGKLIVLVDSNSASASELFARMIQLEKRGTVLGDQTAGAVMESNLIRLQRGALTMIFYGVSVTVADPIMPDGKSLEHVGVAPDEVVIPTGMDLAGNRDVTLARAAALAGVQIDPAKAAALFPIEWKKQ